MTPRVRFGLRILVSVSLVVGMFAWLGPGELLARLRRLDPGWAAVALALSLIQVVGSAWRWRFTLRRLGGDLPFSRAVAEYYLATFLNQLLPGGVVGDVSRAWRHAAGAGESPDPDHGRRAVSAVILERASGQGVMTGVAVVSAFLLLGGTGGTTAAAIALAMAVLAGAAGTVLWRRLRHLPAVARFADDAVEGLLARDALPVQFGTSAVVVGSYLAMYLAAAAALGVETPPARLLPLVAPVLVTMLLPVSVAGWGVREAAAAALWGALGLTPGEGVAISVAYGLLVLVSSLPGAAVLAFTPGWWRGPDRKGGPSPAGSDAPVDAAPGPGSR